MDKIGRFEIVGKLGRGAFGMVYQGRDPIISRMAAIKVMSEATVGDPELVQRFKREAEAAGGLNHRNIVTIYDLGDHNGLPYIAMEYLEGSDLEKMIKERHDFTIDELIDIMIQVADGLQYAHERRIVHRDIKPANIRMLADGTVKIMDFGIAKMASSDMTRTGQFMGTVNYMSPEQIKAGKIDGRSDLFAVGILFYEMLSRRRPFLGDSITAVIYKIVNENPPPLKEVQGTEYEWLEGVVFKCLEKDVERRWPDCKSFADALRSKMRVKVSLGASSTEKTLILAQQKASEGDVETALAQLDSILEQDPENASVISQKKSILLTRTVKEAESLMSGGRLEQARDLVLKAKETHGDAESLERVLKSIQEELNAAQAEQYLDSAARHLEGEEKRYEAAIDLLTKALELDPYSDRIKTTLARAREDKRAADVRELLDEANNLVGRDQFAEARTTAEKALVLDPQSRLARTALQTIEREAQQSKTRTASQEALFQARTALQKGENETALKAVEEALTLDPRSSDARALRDQVLQAKLKTDRRAAIAEHVMRGRKLLNQGKFGPARQAFEKAVDLDPDADEAKLGIEAARRRLRSIEHLQKRPTKVIVGAVAAVLLVALIAVVVLTRKSESLQAVLAGDQALAQGQLDTAYERYLAASGLPGKSQEQVVAKAKLAGLYEPLVQKGELIRAREVLDQLSKWPEHQDGLRGRYLELARGLRKRGISTGDVAVFKAAGAAYESYFEIGDYNKVTDYDVLREEFLDLGIQGLAQARDTSRDAVARLDLYAVAKRVFTRVDEIDLTLGADLLAAEAAAEMKNLDEAVVKVKKFQDDADRLIKKAQEAESTSETWVQAIESYEGVRRLVAENQGISEYVNLERYQSIADSAVRNLNQRLTEAAANATVQDLMRQAKALEDAGNVTAAIQQYERVLEGDPNQASARAKVVELKDRVERLAQLRKEVADALNRGDLAGAEQSLATAQRLAPSDTELAGARATLDERKKQANEANALAGIFAAAERSLSQGNLDAAEAGFRDIMTQTNQKEFIERANQGIRSVRQKRDEAQISPMEQAAAQAEVKGDVETALAKYREIERINANWPGVSGKIAELNRRLKKDLIEGLERDLKAAWAARNSNPGQYDQVKSRLRDEDRNNQALAQYERWLSGLSKARSFLQDRDPDAAAKVLQGVQDPEAETLKKQVSQQKGQRDEGVEALRKAESALAARNKTDRDRHATRAKEVWPPLSAQADALLRTAISVATPEPAATPVAIATTPAPTAAPTAPPQPAGGLDRVIELAQKRDWLGAAAALESAGGGVEPADAGAIYFNASHTAVCTNRDLTSGLAWAEKAAAAYDDSARAGTSANPKWVATLRNFSSFDQQLEAACGQIRAKRVRLR